MGEEPARGVAGMSHRWLVLRFDAPLMALGAIAIDQVGPVRDFPATSMIVGLIGNALGWHWRDRDAHQSIQNRLVFGARRECEGALLTDVQNAQLAKSDKGWTTHGEPQGRAGASYSAPHRRTREYYADLSVRIVMRLDPPDPKPTLDDLAIALDTPARPLFLGRKACLPARPLLDSSPERWVTADTAHGALLSIPGEGEKRALWPAGEGPETGEGVDRIADLPDLRNWRVGYHAGTRRVVEGRLSPASVR